MQNITNDMQIVRGQILQGDLNGVPNSYHIVLDNKEQTIEILSISTKLIPKSYKIITNNFIVQSNGRNGDVKIAGYLKKENIFKTTVSGLLDISNGGRLKLTSYSISEQTILQIESALYYQPVLKETALFKKLFKFILFFIWSYIMMAIGVLMIYNR